MSRPVRARFSPSPTGYFHVGGGRSVLYNWFLARQSLDGVLILRIEDTDRERHGEEHVDGIRAAIHWLGLDWDEEYRQSERSWLYAQAAQRLVDEGKAYYCNCTRDEIDARKPPGAPQGGYDKFCRDRGLPAGDGAALRFKVPPGTTIVNDVVRGDVEFDNANIEDFVIQRADGSALFVLANTVDDIDMRVTHVVRGEEHLPNTPKNILLWHALDGGELPVFGHLSVIVDEKRRKLSKRRDGDLVVMEKYALEGYLPDAMRNYLALLGWSPGENREILPVDEMIELFRLEDVNVSSAFFDVKKLRAFNGEYIRDMTVDEFVAACEPWLDFEDFDAEVFGAIAPEVQTRIEVLSDVPGLIDWLFVAPDAVVQGEVAAPMLEGCLAAFETCPWDHDGVKAAIESVGEANGLRLGKAQAPIRLAVMGKPHGLPITSIASLPRDEVLRRLTAARNTL
ncbi:MAG TPA: glutamate--tRNA ligase [Acidimicrobiales bacterium]|nr:glutamate--tRNA ligase [Acidimicrobiales bacterium]